MTLASFIDANNHLDINKVAFENDPDALPEATSADRYVRGRLVTVFGATNVANWFHNPTGGQVATPELVREIAGMYMAAERYENKYSLEADGDDNYAVRLRKRANDLLDQIIAGDISLIEVTIISGVTFSQSDFFPDGTPSLTGVISPKFYMDVEW